LRARRGFGPKLEQNILAALAKPVAEKRFKLPVAEAEANSLVKVLSSIPDHGHIVVAGSYRRRHDTVGDLDVLVMAYESSASTLAHGPTRTTVVLRSGLQVDLRVVPEESYGAALMYFTGSKAHSIALRSIANEHGWKLNDRDQDTAANQDLANARECG
jgi:DNA polymerase (family X)